MIFAMLQYLYSDVALHSLHIFCDIALFEVFRALGTGARWRTGIGARWTQFSFDPILFAFAGQAGLGMGAALDTSCAPDVRTLGIL
jgi:hypothetical protein